MNKIQINPIESPEVVIWIFKHIIDAVKAPNAKYTPKPGIKYFHTITGSQAGHNFQVEHIPPKKRGETDQIYASFDNFEVQCDLGLAYSYFIKLENHINKNFVYDTNSDAYVLRPRTQNIWEITTQWLNSRRR